MKYLKKYEKSSEFKFKFGDIVKWLDNEYF